MKTLVNIVRIFVGVLFIFSGIVKAIDPLGLSYKMQEYFNLWGLSHFNSTTLWLSVIMNGFEIIAGVALLLGWKPKLINWLLLLLIVFFTFLTGYSYLTGKFKSCGCFGDCIPITSGVSFLKDIILLGLIVFLFFNVQYIQPLFSKIRTSILLIAVTVFTLALQWYVLNYLPVVDCLPYKIGNNISEKMQMPAHAIPDSTVINFVYKKDGKEIAFTAENFPEDFNDSTYIFIKREDKIIRPGKNNIPEIRNFIFHDKEGNDRVHEMLDADKTLVLFIENMHRPLQIWQASFEELYQAALSKNIPVYAITAARDSIEKAFAGTAFSSITLLQGDDVTIRTAARVNPTVFLLEKGTIKGKWSYKEFSKARNAISKQ